MSEASSCKAKNVILSTDSQRLLRKLFSILLRGTDDINSATSDNDVPNLIGDMTKLQYIVLMYLLQITAAVICRALIFFGSGYCGKLYFVEFSLKR